MYYGYIKWIILLIFLIIESFNIFLKILNLKYLRKKGKEVPPDFESHIDETLLSKTVDYTIEKTKFGFFDFAFDLIIIIIFIFGGILDYFVGWIESITKNFILQGIIFSLTLYYISTLLSIPFSLYVDFKIENKYGFNTTTPKLWATDLFKSLIISTILIIIMVSVSCWLIVKLPSLWWLMVWLFTLLFSIFLMYISPYIIEPLFNKFSPAPPQIEEKIKELTERVKITVSKVMVMDASKRSKHSNAYFTGIGKTKRIVLFDTLLSTMNPSEIISIIAHEAGHWKKKHLLKRIVATELLSLAIIYLSYRILETPFLTSIFEYHNNNFFAKLVLLTFIFSIVFFPFTPLLSFLSRRHETEADNFAISNISNSQDYINALIKLSKDNLINLHPHPFYAKFYYSHPPVLERIEKIKRTAGVKDN